MSPIAKCKFCETEYEHANHLASERQFLVSINGDAVSHRLIQNARTLAEAADMAAGQAELGETITVQRGKRVARYVKGALGLTKVKAR